jgi:hypothetical protein
MSLKTLTVEQMCKQGTQIILLMAICLLKILIKFNVTYLIFYFVKQVFQ